MGTPDISIIIVNYNSNSLLFECLSSIKNFVSVDYEVVVVDNASTDDSLSRCSCFEDDSRFRFITLDRNVGFAKGNNAGVSAASSGMFHFLNPDTRLSSGINEDYRYVLSHPDMAYVSPLINSNGVADNPDRVIPCLKDIFWWNFKRSKARYWCIGATIILSRELFEKVGGWSEDYFMYSEDVDLFYNFWLEGVPIFHLKNPVYHFGGGCSSGVWSSLEREIAVQKSFRIFYAKYFPKIQYVSVKIYFIIHDIFKHPCKTMNNIRAWRGVAKIKY